MSSFTNKEHEAGLQATLYWQDKRPRTPAEALAYGDYQYALKDYRQAVYWYNVAIAGQLPAAQYQLAYCLCHQLGACRNEAREQALFRAVRSHDLQKQTVEGYYRLGMLHMYGWGTEVDEKTGLEYFHAAETVNPAALYEIGLAFLLGKGGLLPDEEEAQAYLCSAYDRLYEPAIFALFAVYRYNWTRFPYKQELYEAYSFQLGRLLRVAHVNPCAEYWNRLADFYQQGYPEDTEDNKKKFAQLAEAYRKRAVVCMLDGKE